MDHRPRRLQSQTRAKQVLPTLASALVSIDQALFMAKGSRDSKKPAEGTLNQWIEFFTGRIWRTRPNGSFLGWPPDTFAVAASLLRETGAYTAVLGDWPPKDIRPRTHAGYCKWVQKVSQSWKESIAEQCLKCAESSSNNGEPLRNYTLIAIPEVTDLWCELFHMRETRLDRADDAWHACIKLCALADSSADLLVGLGVNSKSPAGKRNRGLTWPVTRWMLANITNDDFTISNLCSPLVNRDRMIVLPKMRTPQNGITIRSLSHNLALLPNVHVRPRWQYCDLDSKNNLHDGINLMIFPWPVQIQPVQFRAFSPPKDRRLPGDFRFFEFQSQTDPEQEVSLVTRAVEEGIKRFGSIDGVVFPEMALSPESADRIWPQLEKLNVSFAIGGIYKKPDGRQYGKNYARISSFHADSREAYEDIQHKHHRWMLESSQIRTYGLGTQLNPRYNWWEYIDVRGRTLQFLQMSNTLTMSVLICEDLARPDPVGDVIRAIGPNLLVALLQDGPQLANRWSARYATVFADDPGCSVLTLTGLGMADLSRPAGTKTPSRVISLWKEPNSPVRELEFPIGAHALVLCLSHETRGQWTADGRTDGNRKFTLTLSGVHDVRF